jgi:hypothetical protein
MGVQREPGQKGISWSNIAVGTFDPSSDTTNVELLLTPLLRIGGIMNMVIAFYTAYLASANRCTRFRLV